MAIEPQQMQEGFVAPAPMEDADAGVGMINEAEAMPPQEGGEMSVADDIPQTADEGDFILPYESVLLHGLNQLNRYAKEAIELAMENDVDLTGTQLDPTDDVPIRISNYEYRIPKGLVPFFGGGKKYLDKLQKEGLELRTRLEEEGQEPVTAQQKEEAPIAEPTMQEGFAQEAPAMPQEAMPQEAMPQEAMPPQGAPAMPMMEKGGFVQGYAEGNSVEKEDKYLNHDHPEVTKDEYKRFRTIFGRRLEPDGRPIRLSDVDMHNAYVQMKSNKNFSDVEIFEMTNAKVHEKGQREQKQESGGFVISKDKDAEILEQDTSDATNEQRRTMAQQPAMVTPNGQTVKQGFSAPSGYADGGQIHQGLGFEPKDITPKNVSQMRQNAQDALNVLSGYEKSFLTKQRTDEKLV